MASGVSLTDIIQTARLTPLAGVTRLSNSLTDSIVRLFNGELSRKTLINKELREIWLLFICRNEVLNDIRIEEIRNSLINLTALRDGATRISPEEVNIFKERLLALQILKIGWSGKSQGEITPRLLELIITTSASKETITCRLAIECALSSSVANESLSAFYFYLTDIICSNSAKRSIKIACLYGLHNRMLSTKQRPLLLQEADSSRLSKAIAQFLLLPKQSMQPVTRSSRGKQPGLEDSLSSELDGAQARDIFTVLNITQRFTSQHLLNIASFSILKSWCNQLSCSEFDHVLERDFDTISKINTSSPMSIGRSVFYDQVSASTNSSPGNSSLASSISSANSMFFIDDTKSEAERSQLKSPERRLSNVSSLSISGRDTPLGFTSSSTNSMSLLSTSVRYCIRIINQADRMPQRNQDKAIQYAAVVESITILDILCQNDKNLIHKVMTRLKQLASRVLTTAVELRQIAVALIQFYINHSNPVMNETEDLLRCYLNDIPAKLYTSSSCTFECLDLLLKNQEYLKDTPDLIPKYFPNLFKMFAYHPRSFVEEFLILIPYMFNEKTLVEFFHCLLDFPCISACLKINQSKLATGGKWLDQPVPDLENLLINFMLRCESGNGETIDKLSRLHNFIKPLLKDPQIMLPCQIVPLLLKQYFKTVFASKSEKFYFAIFPTLLDRLFHIYSTAEHLEEVQSFLSEKLVQLVTICPHLLNKFKDDAIEALSKVRSSPLKHSFIGTNLIWMVGEMAILQGSCSTEQLITYYEMLETMLYEATTNIKDLNCIPPRMLSALCSALAKLASYNQDLLPRAHLALTKLATALKENGISNYSRQDKISLYRRVNELIQILKMPNVALVVLQSRAGQQIWHLDQNNSIKMKIQNACNIPKF